MHSINTNLVDCKPLSLSFLGAPWSRLWLRISSLVKADIEAASVAKLGRHFNERLLSEVHDRVEAIVARERKGRKRAAQIRPRLKVCTWR
jgi:hypothetical protein